MITCPFLTKILVFRLKPLITFFRCTVESREVDFWIPRARVVKKSDIQKLFSLNRSIFSICKSMKHISPYTPYQLKFRMLFKISKWKRLVRFLICFHHSICLEKLVGGANRISLRRLIKKLYFNFILLKFKDFGIRDKTSSHRIRLVEF